MDAHASSSSRRRDAFVPRSQFSLGRRRASRRAPHGPRSRRTGPRHRLAGGPRPADRGSRLRRTAGESLVDITSREVVRGTLDVSFYRDDVGQRPFVNSRGVAGPRRPRPTASSCWSTTSSSPVAPFVPPSTPWRTSADPGGAAGGDGRPGPPRAADPPGLRRQEPADVARPRRSSRPSRACGSGRRGAS